MPEEVSEAARIWGPWFNFAERYRGPNPLYRLHWEYHGGDSLKLMSVEILLKGEEVK